MAKQNTGPVGTENSPREADRKKGTIQGIDIPSGGKLYGVDPVQKTKNPPIAGHQGRG